MPPGKPESLPGALTRSDAKRRKARPKNPSLPRCCRRLQSLKARRPPTGSKSCPSAGRLLVELVEALCDVLHRKRGVLAAQAGRLQADAVHAVPRPSTPTFSCWWPQATKISVTTYRCGGHRRGYSAFAVPCRPVASRFVCLSVCRFSCTLT